MARQGKIARLPHALRVEVNNRLLNGESGPQILAWLNETEEAKKVWKSHFEGKPANEENLSSWRQGGYRDWLKKREELESLKSLSSWCLKVTKAGGNISDGAATIAAGKLLQRLELGDADEDFDIHKVSSAIAQLRQGDRAKEKQELDEEKHGVKKQEVALAREKFEMQATEKIFQWAKTPEAQEILNSGKPKGVQMDKLRKLMFG